MKTGTRDHLIHQIANAKKAVADIEAEIARAGSLVDKVLMVAKLRRGEVYRDNLEAVLADYDRGMSGSDAIAE